MQKELLEIFNDKDLVNKIKKRLPYLFQLAEIESSRAGKIGMEVGSLRERIIIALLIYKFGRKNVNTDIPITKPEIDVIVYKNPISIKTETGSTPNGFKLIWTVDAKKAGEFKNNYYPLYDILYVHINWKSVNGGFYYIPIEAQKNVFNKIGREQYIKLPKQGTNPRGVTISKQALINLIKSPFTHGIEILWEKTTIDYDPYKKWVDYWKE